MSGPEETSESAVDSASPASDGTPSAPAPPSFGQAGASAMEPAPEPEPEQAAPAPEPEAEQAAPAFTVPLFGPDKPWWAATPEDDQDEPGPESDLASGSEAAAPESARPAASEAPEPPAPAAEGSEDAPAGAPQPGFLVAGAGAPGVDTRGAVPAEPIKDGPLPVYPDTNPDGIPLYPDTNPDGIPLYPGPQDERESPQEPAGLRPPADEAPRSESPAPRPPETTRPDSPGPQTSETTQPEAPGPQTPGTARSAAPEPDSPGSAAPEPKASQSKELVEAGSRVDKPGPGDASPDDDPGAEGALTPDAVLPPGVSPPEYAGPPHDGVPHTASATSAEQLPDGGVILVVTQTPPEAAQPFPETGAEQRQPPPPAAQPMVRRRNQLMIAMVAIVILIPVAVLGAFGLASGGGADKPRAAERPSRSPSPTARRTARAAPPPASRTPAPASIDSEKTDPRPLALVEVFPTKEVQLAERFFVQDRTSVNHQCGLAARGAMINALQRGNCRSVVRATYVNRLETIAVTAGVAVMPSHRAALAANEAGDPAAYEWFRAMPGERSPDIDRAGGHAAGTVRGRYIVYAYATYADGTKPEPGDPTLKKIADEFIGYGLRPIDKRAVQRP